VKSKILSLLLLCVLVVTSVIVGCAPEAPEARPTIKIGVLGALDFESGKHFGYGAKMAVDEINAAGGVLVNGVRYDMEAVIVDSNEMLSVADAVAAAENLITLDKVNCIVGCLRSEAVLGIQDVAADYKTIYLSSSSAPEQSMRVAKDYDRYKYWFRVGTVHSGNAGKIIFGGADLVANAVRRDLGIDTPKVAVVLEKLTWTEPMIPAAQGLLPKLGMEIVGIWQPSATASDVTAELSDIKDSGAHMIMRVVSGPITSVLDKQWGELQIPAALCGFNLEGTSYGFWENTMGKCNYAELTSVNADVKASDITLPFYDNFVERYGELPLLGATMAYDSPYILKAAIERADTLDSDALVIEIEKTDQPISNAPRCTFDPLGSELPHEMTFGPGYMTGYSMQWQDGKLMCVWPDGRPFLGDKKWEGLRYEGTVDYKLPPWMVEYWKSK